MENLIKDIISSIPLFSVPPFVEIGKELTLNLQLLISLSLVKKLMLLGFVLVLFGLKVGIFSLINRVKIKQLIKPFIFSALIDLFLIKPAVCYGGAYLGIYLGKSFGIATFRGVAFPLLIMIILMILSTVLIEFTMVKTKLVKGRSLRAFLTLLGLNFFSIGLLDK